MPSRNELQGAYVLLVLAYPDIDVLTMIPDIYDFLEVQTVR